MTRRTWTGTAIAAAVLLLAACATGSSEPSTSTSGTSSESATTTEPMTSEPAETTPATTEQPAVWPAADTVYATPEEAAADFVEQALGVPPNLGEFMAGDSRSGEMQLLFAGEDGATPIERSLLLLRQLGASDGWFVTAAVSDYAQITSPEQGATVPAGSLELSGMGRGFEGTVLVEAFRPGDPTPLDTQIAQGGSMETAEPFTVTLDLSAATPGETIALVVHGGTGHELDPGELGAIAVTIAG
ncbi:Gmad2 immunoglobulin-like domain-containing protein [Actinotalea sp. M2MS4P-6]|uniref:Gmad2 immunoglobulin-like domain-containing protein n=1 Tax=Actinotalea sp. M2MS4P-6 TaxID=2983762 RepID=UPI0021E44D4E|nr:Gmad2 immunoglobulin-like domain-containing protein [Actinotalea sp. M2MS4P-6]MCV2394976.1 Gmad2 immunoglobulin-like domain-containing protein [Actinotalea sp. M2MS4P-6]